VRFESLTRAARSTQPRAEMNRLPSPIQVVIIDEHPLVCEVVRLFLEIDPDIQVIGTAEDGRSGVALVRERKPHVVIMDVMMPDTDGVAATTITRQEMPATQIIGLSSTMEARWLVGTVRAGALGYLAEDTKAVDLCRAVHAVAAGQVQLSPEAADQLMYEMRSPTPEPLSPRESEVLQMLVSGKSNKEIGRALNITITTVKTHLSIIRAKLGVESRTQAALLGIQKGIVRPEGDRHTG
jgi:two-component system, NarL family, response regulator LiaR